MQLSMGSGRIAYKKFVRLGLLVEDEFSLYIFLIFIGRIKESLFSKHMREGIKSFFAYFFLFYIGFRNVKSLENLIFDSETSFHRNYKWGNL